jgi:hypothetical protein
MNQGKERRRIAIYLLLFAVQVFGSGFIVLEGLPAFRQLALSPGDQPAYTPYDDTAVFAVLLAMQGAYWYRYISGVYNVSSGINILENIILVAL